MSKEGDFGDRFLQILNDGMLCLMTSVGHKAGLFDAMARLAPSTSIEIANAAKLNERYVREWLGAMVTGRIVDYDPSTGRYSLPAAHASCLTRAAGIDNLAMFTRYIALMGSVEDDIVKCFKKEGASPIRRFQNSKKSRQRRLPVSLMQGW